MGSQTVSAATVDLFVVQDYTILVPAEDLICVAFSYLMKPNQLQIVMFILTL